MMCTGHQPSPVNHAAAICTGLLCVQNPPSLPHRFKKEEKKKDAKEDRRGKTSHLLRKIVGIKETFCPKMGKIKDRNSRDLVDTEEIKKRSKEYMQELCTKRS